MTPLLMMLIGLLLFVAGIQLSFFFSGCETGFYRVSPLQLSIRAHQGDRVAAGLQRFVTRPERFVATALVGNNIANYCVTIAMGLMTSAFLLGSSGTAEVLSTLVVTPVVFIFGEMIPKSLFYLAPMSRLRLAARWFSLAYAILLPLSYPLIVLSRLIARMGNSDRQSLELVLSRTRLVSVLEAGHREGLLTEMQSQLAENVMQVSRRPVTLSMIPALAVQGIVETVDRDAVLRLARRLRVSRLLLHPPGRPGYWTASLRVADLFGRVQSPRSLATPIPQFAADASKLEVLSELIRCRSAVGAVVEGDRMIGVVTVHALLGQLQRVGPWTQAAEDIGLPDRVSASIRQAIGTISRSGQTPPGKS